MNKAQFRYSYDAPSLLIKIRSDACYRAWLESPDGFDLNHFVRNQGIFCCTGWCLCKKEAADSGQNGSNPSLRAGPISAPFCNHPPEMASHSASNSSQKLLEIGPVKTIRTFESGS